MVRANDDAGVQRRVLATLLAPWMDVYSQATGTCSLPLDDDAQPMTNAGLVVTLDFAITREIWAGTNEPLRRDLAPVKIVRMREAIDLLRLALALEPTLVYDLEDEVYFSTNLYEDQFSAELDRGARCLLDLCFSFAEHDVFRLDKFIAQQVIGTIQRGEVSDDFNYRTTRDELVRKTRDKGRFGRTCGPVSYSFYLSSPQAITPNLLQAEDYLIILSELVASVRSISKCNSDETAEVVMVYKSLRLAANRLHLTEKVVDAARRFAAAIDGMRFECTHIVLDPRYIACSSSLVRDVLEALATDFVKVSVGMIEHEDSIHPFDAYGQDRSSAIESIFHAVALCPMVARVNIGGIMMLFHEASNRKIIFRELINSLLARSSSLSEIEIAPATGLFGRDEAVLALCMDEWKTQNPGKELRVQTLILDFVDSQPSFFEVLLKGIDAVEHLTLVNDLSPSLPSQVVSLVMEKFSNLRELTLSNASIDSMEVFHQPGRAVLRKLILKDIKLSDPSSFVAYLDELRRPSVSSTRNLVELTMCQVHRERNIFTLAEREVESLESLLDVNKRLAVIEVTVSGDPSFCRAAQTMLDAHTDDAVYALLTEDERRRELSRRCAFFSCLRDSAAAASAVQRQLDALVVRNIFEFSSPHVQRQIKITRKKPVEEDYDDEELEHLVE